MRKSMRNFTAQCFQLFENKRWITWWNDILITIPNCPRFWFAPKMWKQWFFSRLLLEGWLWPCITCSFNSILNFFFFPWLICMSFVYHQILTINGTWHLGWSFQNLQLWRLLKTKKFKFSIVAIFHFSSNFFLFIPKHSAWSHLQFY